MHALPGISKDFLALAVASLAARQRLDLPPGRCFGCKDRPAVVCDPDPYDPPVRRRPLPTAEDLAACALCGWQPEYIAVSHVDELTGEHWTTAEMMVRVDRERAPVEEIGQEAVIELERRRHAAHHFERQKEDLEWHQE